MRYTKKLRQEIVAEFTRRHNGQFDAKLFFNEVRDAGPNHPAHSWFEWNVERGWVAHNVDLARAFVQDLKIAFAVTEITHTNISKLETVEMPLMHSPLADRRRGGGYVRTEPSSVPELCRQGAAALRSWLGRYRDILVAVGGSDSTIEGVISILEDVVEEEAA